MPSAFGRYFPETAQRIAQLEQWLEQVTHDVQSLANRVIGDKDSLAIRVSNHEGTIRGLETQIRFLENQLSLQRQKKYTENAAWIGGLLALAGAIIGAVLTFLLSRQ